MRSTVFSPRLVLGLALLVAGILAGLDRAGVLHSRLLSSAWPLALVALGLVQLFVGDNRFARVLGLGLALLGGALVLANLRPELLRSGEVWHYAWPVGLALLGLFLVWNPLSPPSPASSSADGADRVRIFTFWSGSERRSDSRSFQGGELTSIMGGYELDLRQADIEDGGEAVLDVLAVMGGETIRVPESWSVRNDVLPVMGGVSVKARAPQSAPRKCLRLTGLALMGGLEVRN